VHPYRDLDGMLAALAEHAVPLRQRLARAGRIEGHAPLGVGLWFPEPVANEVAADARPLADALAHMQLDVFTLNAFPQGAFHEDVVKDAVFRPSWSDRARLDYTLTAARALAALIPEGATGSVSTHTGAYKPWGPAEVDPDGITRGFLRAAEGLADLERRTGRRIVLALEPEPFSFLETTDEVIRFFTSRLQPAGEHAVRHLGICYDACHQAVQFEDMATSVRALATAGVPIAKVQLSSAIRVREPGRHLERLRPFAEDRWFHQVVARHADGRLERVADLPLALEDVDVQLSDEWRIHYHVPIFAAELDEQGALQTTRPQLEQLLAEVSDVTHLEIETYTYNAIPESRRRRLGVETLVDCLEQEFCWVADRLS
jgi:sugar phosphate isomerase/epimerase